MNVKFWVKILGCHNVVVKWIHQTGIWTKHFCETRNAECLWEVNQFTKWIQTFWRFLNQNSAFSHSSDMHHILEFCTSCWYSVAKWLWKISHMLYDEKDANIRSHFFVANFSDNIIVLNTSKFQVLPTISLTFFFKYLPKPANQTLQNKN